jgi:hydrocephalus-inducing protein
MFHIFLFSIPNLETGKVGPVVAVRGRSILPFCHFELEESDYLTSGRRRIDLLINNGSTQAPNTFIDRQTRVIEFKSVGVGSTLNRLVDSDRSFRKDLSNIFQFRYYDNLCFFSSSFSVLNPTDNDYTYRWICEDNLDLTRQPAFVCRTLQGKLGSGKGVSVSDSN